jgi:hypothetical protein
VTTPEQDYRRMMGALADVTRRRDDELDRTERAYRDSTGRVLGELARSEGDATSADHWAGVAAGQVLDVDREAARLWDELRQAHGPRLRSLGDLGEPAPIEAMRPGPGLARALLARADLRIKDSVRPVTGRPLQKWALPLLPLVGALIAGAVVLLAAGLVTIGGAGVPAGDWITDLGWLCFLLAPSAGLPVAALLARRGLRARLRLAGIALTLLGGMPTATLLALRFAPAHG